MTETLSQPDEEPVLGVQEIPEDQTIADPVCQNCLNPASISCSAPLCIDDLMKQLYRLTQIKQTVSLVYTSQCNGAAERVIQSLKNMLRHYADTKPRKWEQVIPLVILAYNNTLDNGCSAPGDAAKYEGPYEVVARLTTVSYKIKNLQSQKTKVVHFNRLRKLAWTKQEWMSEHQQET